MKLKRKIEKFKRKYLKYNISEIDPLHISVSLCNHLKRYYISSHIVEYSILIPNKDNCVLVGCYLMLSWGEIVDLCPVLEYWKDKSIVPETYFGSIPETYKNT